MEDIFTLSASDEIEIAIRLVLAAIFGAAIGFERRTSEKPAGVRTLALVAVGAALFTVVSIFGFDSEDKSRVAAQVVTGVGFLGAGAILRSGVSITGLTTAATIWATAAIGMAVGAGLYIIAAVVTVLALLILLGFHRPR